MNGKRTVFGVGVVLLVLAVLTAHAAAENRAYFVPQHSNASTGNYTWVTLYVDLQEGDSLASGQMEINFDRAHANITKVSKGCGPPEDGKHCWGAIDVNYDWQHNGYNWAFVGDPQRAVWDDGEECWIWETIPGGFQGPMTVKICKYKVEADGAPGVGPFNFGFEYTPSGCPDCQDTRFFNGTGIDLDMTWENGTFTHVGEPETFTKPLAPGWNLISLPLTPDDSSTSAVLASISGNYSTVLKYVPGTGFEDATTMEPGIGYFIDMTAADTWLYDGIAYESMSVPLSQGLNCVGWTNTSADIPGGALDSIAGNYRYVARWNAAEHKYEVYDPVGETEGPEFIDFTTMERGVGYFVAATTGCTLTYP